MGLPRNVGNDLSIISLNGSDTIRRTAEECYQIFTGNYQKVCVSVSGGSDSDVLIDLCTRFDPDRRFTYVYCDTGMEYQATKEHIGYLEHRYGITINRLDPEVPIPDSCKKAQPFLSKTVSIYLGRLMAHGFQFEDESFDVLYKRYPKCKSALQFWCNEFGEGSKFNISRYSYLKEFMIQNPPWFTIGNLCCRDAKLDPIDVFGADEGVDLQVMGVRKAEGGQRSSIHSCLSCRRKGEPDLFRPILHWTDMDKATYNENYGIVNSDCYTVYGLRRTGCAGCPCGRKRCFELDVCYRYEPELYSRAMESFKDSYEYERQWRVFREKQKAHARGQFMIWDMAS